MRPINVLMVDDDVMVQTLAGHILEDRGMMLWTAYDTLEADSILQQHSIDVIICDVMMTPENGLDYYNRLRDRRVKTPVILMSGLVSPVWVKNGVRHAPPAYLMKPFGIDQMYQRIVEALATTASVN